MSQIELNLVCVENISEKTKTFYAVNDKHYDGMLASGDIEGFKWEYIGSVYISQEIISEIIENFN